MRVGLSALRMRILASFHANPLTFSAERVKSVRDLRAALASPWLPLERSGFSAETPDGVIEAECKTQTATPLPNFRELEDRHNAGDL